MRREPRPRNRWERFIAWPLVHGVRRSASRLHAALYRATGGRPGRGRYLLLTTRGRRSGLARTVPLNYVADDGRWSVLAANGGAARDPGWLHNLRADRQARLQIGGVAIEVRARVASGAERQRLLARLQAAGPLYRRCGPAPRRDLAVVVLEPREGARGGASE